MARSQWNTSNALIDALHPSTSKSHVLPRLNRSVFIDKNEIIENFFASEKLYAIPSDYFGRVQVEVTPDMRTILLQWMAEVCEEEGCSCEIFPLAATYVDRFLSVEAIHKEQLQTLGTACLFVASKVKMVSPMAASRLVDYTDEAVTVSEILSWELLLLDRLNWDVSTLTAFDFLDQYLHRLNLAHHLIARLRPYLNYLVNISLIDFPTATLPPSLIAASCLQVAAMHVCGDAGGRRMIAGLKEMTGLETDNVDIHASTINSLFTSKRHSCHLKCPLPCAAEHLRLDFDDFAMLAAKSNRECSSDTDNNTSSMTPTEIEDVIF